MKRLSELAREPAGLWLSRVDASRKFLEDKIAERKKYSLALSLKYNNPTGFDSADREVLAELEDGAHDVPYLFRYTQWLKSQTAGEKPYIEYPQDDGTPTEFAQFAAKLIGKVIEESGALDEWRDATTRLSAFGAETVWYGFHADVVGVEEAQGAGESLRDTFDRIREPVKTNWIF